MEGRVELPESMALQDLYSLLKSIEKVPPPFPPPPLKNKKDYKHNQNNKRTSKRPSA